MAVAEKKETKYFSSVRKRDGRVVPYSKSKIAKVLLNVGEITGEVTRLISLKLADNVENYLKERFFPGETLSADTIANAMEFALKHDDYALTAKAYRHHHQMKQKMKKKLTVSKSRTENSNSTDIALLVVTESEDEIIPWNKSKIAAALEKEAGIPLKVAGEIAQRVEKKLIASQITKVTTSLIRELVDHELVVLGYEKKMQKQTSLGIPIYNLESLIFSKSQENSNLAANNPEAVNLAIAEIILKQYALHNIFSEDVANAHYSGAIHLHDLGYPTRVYCSTHSLEYIKKYGLELENLNIVSSPARHAHTLTGHLNTFLASMQAYYAGALGIAYTNIAYAPYVVGYTYEQLVQEAQYLIYSCAQNAFSRGGQTLFIDFNIHTGVPEYLKDVPAIGPGGKYTGKNYGEYEKEAQMFARAMMDVWRKGDAYGQVFEFPKMDLHINQATLDEPAQYEILEYACQISSENGSPYFVFDRDEVTLSQCCRLRTTLNLSDEFDKRMIKHPESMRFCGFQNVTINLPQAAYRAGKGNIDGMINEVLDMMDICVKAHLQKKKFIHKLMLRRGLPLWQIGKEVFDGFPYVDLEKASYIMGMIGLNEAVQFLVGQQLHESDDAFKLGLKIVSHMFIKINQLGEKHKLKFVLEESPAESAARRMAKIDMEKFSEQTKSVLKGSVDEDMFYYTNSVHFSASTQMSIIERIEKLAKFHSMIAAGAIIHAFVGEQQPAPESILNLVKKTWYNTKAAQIVVSPEFSICSNCHKSMRGLKDVCSYCGSANVPGVMRVE
ncbi:MAG: anaerobic ribonucleoside-triphosphate reductase [Elusimicrobiota bacterium]